MSTRSDPAGATLVIDFGNTSSAAALVSGDRSQLVPEPVSGALSWPSAVYWDGRQMLIGTLAEHQRQRDPGGFGVDFKRGLAVDAVSLLGTHRFRAIEQVAAMLTALRLEAERIEGGPVRRALITVPAGYGPADPRRAWMVAAGEAAGFTAVELLPEPVAAAYAPVAGPGMAAGDLVLVYDLGGGTFDAALVRIGEQTPEILGHAAVDECGGRDIDTLLSRRITEAGKQWLEPLTTADDTTTLRLSMAVTEFAQQVKHQLSDAASVEDYLLPSAPPYRLDQQELAALAAPVLNRTVVCCRQLLARLDVPLTRVATILLVGGGSRMPAVVDLLAREFGRPLRRVEEPDLATVRGAVRWLEHSGPRRVPAVEPRGRAVPLAFAVPGGDARLLRWLVGPGEAYTVGQVLGRVRLPGGSSWELTAAADGTLDRMLVTPGEQIAAGQWLALALA
jgi:molecular chaperone DnaK (HSP70)